MNKEANHKISNLKSETWKFANADPLECCDQI